jgi:hypothetical protein
MCVNGRIRVRLLLRRLERLQLGVGLRLGGADLR